VIYLVFCVDRSPFGTLARVEESLADTVDNPGDIIPAQLSSLHTEIDHIGDNRRKIRELLRQITVDCSGIRDPDPACSEMRPMFRGGTGRERRCSERRGLRRSPRRHGFGC
jgi:hypothetical protein